MNKQPKYTKHDFHVGQEVYVETIYGRGEGNIRAEIVEKVGHKYVTTNRDIYHLSDGRNKSEYAQCYEIWTNLDEVSDKVLHDQLAKEYFFNIFKFLGKPTNYQWYGSYSWYCTKSWST